MNFTAIIATFLVICVLGACLFSFARRLSGRKSCCQTAAPRVKPKKLKTPIGSITVRIEGMRCESCRRTLMAKLNEPEGVSAKVSLDKKEALICYERPIEQDKIAEIVEKAGFEVVEIYR